MTTKKKKTPAPEPTPEQTGWDPAKAKSIVLAVKAGNYLEVAAKLAGVARSTLYVWTKKGAQGREPFATFHAQLQEALAASEARDVATIGAAARTDWKAAAWRLSRRFPQRWADRWQVHQIAEAKAKEDVRAILEIVAAEADPGTTRRILARIERALGGAPGDEAEAPEEPGEGGSGGKGGED